MQYLQRKSNERLSRSMRDLVQKSEVIYILRAWNIPTSSKFHGTEIPMILFSVKMDEIRKLFDHYTKNTKGYLVLDEEGNSVFNVNLSKEQSADINEIIKKQNSLFQEDGTFLNKQWFIAGILNEKTGWHIYSAESTKDAFEEMNCLIRNINLIILAAGGISICLTVFFTGKIMMPITLLNQLISTIEEENDTFIQVQTNDELGQIGKRFNQMKCKLQTMSANMYLTRVQEKEAQLSALQSQINPHFLYNTLDNIYCIAQIEEVENIVQLSESLSGMMRYSMDMKSRNVLVQKELEHVRSYVNIINIRFDQSIHLEVCLREEVKQAQMLKLTLQPLVENAWNHGILPKPYHHGTIQIKMLQEEDNLIVTVTDDGVGISKERCWEMNEALASVNYEETLSGKGFGVALRNVNNRIKLTDGEEYGIVLYVREDGGCIVKMRLRMRNEIL